MRGRCGSGLVDAIFCRDRRITRWLWWVWAVRCASSRDPWRFKRCTDDIQRCIVLDPSVEQRSTSCIADVAIDQAIGRMGMQCSGFHLYTRHKRYKGLTGKHASKSISTPLVSYPKSDLIPYDQCESRGTFSQAKGPPQSLLYPSFLCIFRMVA